MIDNDEIHRAGWEDQSDRDIYIHTYIHTYMTWIHTYIHIRYIHTCMTYIHTYMTWIHTWTPKLKGIHVIPSIVSCPSQPKERMLTFPARPNLDGWVDEWMDGWVHGWMYVCIHVCIYVEVKRDTCDPINSQLSIPTYWTNADFPCTTQSGWMDE